MDKEDVTRDDWIIGGLALLLLFGLVAFPWRSISPAAGGPLTGNRPTAAESFTAVKAPARGFAFLAAFVLLLLILDLLFQNGRRKPFPAIGNRRTTRMVLAIVVAVLMALQFLLYLHFSQFGWGFYFDVIVVIVLVLACAQVSRGSPVVPGTRS